mmetsp:Transcript_102248/g.294357  ORF Transcript_102248/g.294357 Transcript_102248/m.294357 type:complete len:248 (-) Transcript_102248:1080-1823(-)
MTLPSTTSNTMATSPLSVSMVAPWNATMFVCLTRRKSRISLQKDSTRRTWSLPPSTRGSLIATGVPRKRPQTTAPKPPLPRKIGGETISRSSLLKNQCSWMPTLTTDFRAFPSGSATSPPRRMQSRSMSLKIFSVAAADGAMLGAASSASSGAAVPGSAATTSVFTFGRCSIWLMPTTNCVRRPSTWTTTNWTLRLAKGSSSVEGVDWSSPVSAALRAAAAKLSLSPSAMKSAKLRPNIAWPKKASN